MLSAHCARSAARRNSKPALARNDATRVRLSHCACADSWINWRHKHTIIGRMLRGNSNSGGGGKGEARRLTAAIVLVCAAGAHLAAGAPCKMLRGDKARQVARPSYVHKLTSKMCSCHRPIKSRDTQHATLRNSPIDARTSFGAIDFSCAALTHKHTSHDIACARR